MVPLPMPVLPANNPIPDGNSADRQHDPPQRPPGPTPRRCVDSEAHEDIPDSVDDHQAIDEVLFRPGRGIVEFKEGERVFWAEKRVDAEADADCAERGGDQGEN